MNDDELVVLSPRGRLRCFLRCRNNEEEETKLKSRPLGDDENPIVDGNTHAEDDADNDDDGSEKNLR